MTDKQNQVEEITPPDPYDIALAAFQGLLANPAYGQNPAAAATQAWLLVSDFFAGAQTFARMQQAAWEEHARIQGQQGA